MIRHNIFISLKRKKIIFAFFIIGAALKGKTMLFLGAIFFFL